MNIGTSPVKIAFASPDDPALIVVQNNGAASTPDVIIGDDPMNLDYNGLHIVQGAASPQITITSVYYAKAASSTQDIIVNINRVQK